MIKTEAIFFVYCINFLCDFPFIQRAWWISFPPEVIAVWMNQSNWTIELSSSSQPEIRQRRVAFYMKSGKGEMSAVTRQKGESQNGCLKKTMHAKFSEKQALFFGKFGVLCFLETNVLRFILFPYYRRCILFSNAISK